MHVGGTYAAQANIMVSDQTVKNMATVANRTFLEALANFMYWENYDVRVRMDGRIDRVVLEDIRKNRRPRR